MPRANLMARICKGTKISFTSRIVNETPAQQAADPYFHAGSNLSSDIAVAKPCNAGRI